MAPLQKLPNIAATELPLLRESIADAIRSSIVDGRLEPGERLTEPQVSKLLGVSRTPVREAFFQLISEGFVEAAPRRGVVVAPLSRDDAEETYLLKGTLEALAAALSVRNGPPGLADELDAINAELRDAVEAKPSDVVRILEINDRFHRTLTEASGKTKLSRLVTVYRRQTLRYNYIYVSALSRLRHSVEEHRAIVAALRRKDAEEMGRLVRLHNEAALGALRTFMASQAVAGEARSHP